MSFRGQPQLKGRTLVEALRSERTIYCYHSASFSVGFAVGATFILWLLLC